MRRALRLEPGSLPFFDRREEELSHHRYWTRCPLTYYGGTTSYHWAYMERERERVNVGERRASA